MVNLSICLVLNASTSTKLSAGIERCRYSMADNYVM